MNIVRKPEQAEILRSIGAKYVCDSSAETLHGRPDRSARRDLRHDRVRRDRRRQAGAARSSPRWRSPRAARPGGYSRYGSTTHKQVYIYGGLDRGPTVLNRAFGMAWGVGGWLLTPFLLKIGAEAAQRLRERVAAEIKTTFASTYAKHISLARGARARRDRGLRQAGDRREVPDHARGICSKEGGTMLRLHGFSASNYYNIAKLALLEKGVPFEEVTVYTGAGAGYRPDYLASSPLGKVPCLETEEGFLTESRCIIDYLERAVPGAGALPARLRSHRPSCWSSRRSSTCTSSCPRAVCCPICSAASRRPSASPTKCSTS